MATTPATAGLLAAWEDAVVRPTADRPLALLAAGAPELSAEARGRLPVGARDARLLALREWAFGQRVAAVAKCPSCGADLELEFDTADVRVPASEPQTDELTIGVDGFEVRFRLPDGFAVRQVADEPTVAAARDALLRRCVVSVSLDGAPVDLGVVPGTILESVETAMSERDPQADVSVELSCSECGHSWEAAFDIVRFLWEELDRWARRLLSEIAILASAFGWTEAEVLGLSPLRREAYLELVGR